MNSQYQAKPSSVPSTSNWIGTTEITGNVISAHGGYGQGSPPPPVVKTESLRLEGDVEALRRVNLNANGLGDYARFL
jgi:hypothetical protein